MCLVEVVGLGSLTISTTIVGVVAILDKLELILCGKLHACELEVVAALLHKHRFRSAPVVHRAHDAPAYNGYGCLCASLLYGYALLKVAIGNNDRCLTSLALVSLNYEGDILRNGKVANPLSCAGGLNLSALRCVLNRVVDSALCTIGYEVESGLGNIQNGILNIGLRLLGVLTSCKCQYQWQCKQEIEKLSHFVEIGC